MTKFSLAFGVLIVLSCTMSSLVMASELVLKSGEKIEGKILEQTDKYITVEPNVGPIKTYNKDQIDSISDDSAQSSQDQPAPVAASAETTTQQPEPQQLPQTTVNQFVQKDGLYRITLPDGWRGQAWGQGREVLLPPPPRGDGIVIRHKPIPDTVTSAQIKEAISSDLNNIIETKIKPIEGSVIDNKETTIDNSYAQYLLYTISLKGVSMVWVRYEIANKGYSFVIDYGDFNRSEVEKVMALVNTMKF